MDTIVVFDPAPGPSGMIFEIRDAQVSNSATTSYSIDLNFGSVQSGDTLIVLVVLGLSSVSTLQIGGLTTTAENTAIGAAQVHSATATSTTSVYSISVTTAGNSRVALAGALLRGGSIVDTDCAFTSNTIADRTASLSTNAGDEVAILCGRWNNGTDVTLVSGATEEGQLTLSIGGAVAYGTGTSDTTGTYDVVYGTNSVDGLDDPAHAAVAVRAD